MGAENFFDEQDNILVNLQDVPQYDTKPSAAAIESGNLVYDKTEGAFFESDGSVWVKRGVTANRVTSLSNLKELDGSINKILYLDSGGRSGIFVWDASDLSTEVTNDPGEGVYVPPDSDTSGASGAWVRRYGNIIHTAWFGAVGDNGVDDTTALQRTIDFTELSFGTMEIGPGTYKTTSELLVDNPIHVIGNGSAGAAQVAISLFSAARSVMSVDSQNVRIDGIEFDAQYNGTYAVYGRTCGRSRFTECRFYRGIKDGFYRRRGGNNNQVIFDRCWFYFNGKAYASDAIGLGPLPSGQVVRHGGTVSITSGSTTVTGSGTLFLSTGARAGDFIKIGSHHYEIERTGPGGHGTDNPDIASDTELTLAGAAQETLSGAEYAILVGEGALATRYGDNNIDLYSMCLFRGNAGGGLSMNGQYGSTVLACQFDTHYAFGIRVGGAANGDIVFGCAIIRPYFEGNVSGPIYGGFQTDLSIVSPMHNASTPLVTEAIGAGSIGYIALVNGAVEAFRGSYDLRNNYLGEGNNSQLWYVPKGSPILDGNSEANGRNLLPARGRASAGSLAAGAEADVTVNMPNAFIVRMTTAQKDALGISGTAEGADGKASAWIKSKDTSVDGAMSVVFRVKNEHSATQTVRVNWIVL